MYCYYHFQDSKKVSRCLFVDILKILLKIIQYSFSFRYVHTIRTSSPTTSSVYYY